MIGTNKLPMDTGSIAWIVIVLPQLCPILSLSLLPKLLLRTNLAAINANATWLVHLVPLFDRKFIERAFGSNDLYVKRICVRFWHCPSECEWFYECVDFSRQQKVTKLLFFTNPNTFPSKQPYSLSTSILGTFDVCAIRRTERLFHFFELNFVCVWLQSFKLSSSVGFFCFYFSYFIETSEPIL